jgi:hypothetical protein
MKIFGFVLVVLGVLALVYGGVSYNRQRTVLDVGPFRATATEQKNVPLSPIVGGIALLGGILLLVIPRKRLAVPTLLSVILLSTSSAGTSRAAQFIPSLGITKATDHNAGGGKIFGGVALRVPLLPFISAEGGIAYRQESFASDDLKVRMWPVTASLWLTPVPMLYAGGGLGWYHTTYDYQGTLPLPDTTTRNVGVHLGGGVAVPLAPGFGLDLNGRYIFMQGDNGVQFPTQFNPDFWSTSVGLAIKF